MAIPNTAPNELAKIDRLVFLLVRLFIVAPFRKNGAHHATHSRKRAERPYGPNLRHADPGALANRITPSPPLIM